MTGGNEAADNMSIKLTIQHIKGMNSYNSMMDDNTVSVSWARAWYRNGVHIQPNNCNSNTGNRDSSQALFILIKYMGVFYFEHEVSCE